eukprot:SAG11_NODE_4021_length_2103_cov_1.700100_1_plen_144_part_00
MAGDAPREDPPSYEDAAAHDDTKHLETVIDASVVSVDPGSAKESGSEGKVAKPVKPKKSAFGCCASRQPRESDEPKTESEAELEAAPAPDAVEDKADEDVVPKDPVGEWIEPDQLDGVRKSLKDERALLPDAQRREEVQVRTS